MRLKPHYIASVIFYLLLHLTIVINVAKNLNWTSLRTYDSGSSAPNLGTLTVNSVFGIRALQCDGLNFNAIMALNLGVGCPCRMP